MKYFTEDELKCSHCGYNMMKADFMDRVIELRRALDFPFVVTSAYRCPVHNSNVSSTGATGPHTTGRAIDIGVSRERAYELIKLAIMSGFTGIGVNQKGNGRFIHLDDLINGRPTVWSY